jgi:protein PhnA
MSDSPKCPECDSEHTYESGHLNVCSMCAHEWERGSSAPGDDDSAVRDANGNVLKDGDTVTVIRDLKVKNTSLVLKVGTKVKKIRLVEGDHNIDCQVEGIGPMSLKSKYVKKV